MEILQTSTTALADHHTAAVTAVTLDGIVELVVGLVIVAGTVAVCTALIVVFSKLGVLFRVVGAITALVGVSAIATGLLYGELDTGQRVMFAGILGPILLVVGVGAFRLETGGSTAPPARDRSDRQLP